jgi:hypothetical protein
MKTGLRRKRRRIEEEEEEIHTYSELRNSLL